MKHVQTETRHLFEPVKPSDDSNIAYDNSLGSKFVEWLEVHCSEDDLKNTMEQALPSWTKRFADVFVGRFEKRPGRYIAVAWNETPDREPILWGEIRPEHVKKYTIQGKPSYMLNDETIAAIVTMLPPERK